MKRVLAILIAAGIHVPALTQNPLLKDAIKATPVVYWSSLGRTEIVKELLAKGESPNSVDDQGWSALHAAAENGHLEIVKLLLSAGANTSYVFSGKTALQLAVFAKQEKVIQYLQSMKAK